MKSAYLKPDPWCLIEEDFSADRVMSSESLFSLGNGAMGQRANFEEYYSGPTFQGSYIAGVYYPDKTKVGWWKNGYPEYFAKVINAPNWIGIDLKVNGEVVDLNKVNVIAFRRVLNMKSGVYERSFEVVLADGLQLKIQAKRFLMLDPDQMGAIRYEVTPLSDQAQVNISPYIDAAIKNKDSNWDDPFWETLELVTDQNRAFITSKTLKTGFDICTYMQARLWLNGQEQDLNGVAQSGPEKLALSHKCVVAKGQTLRLEKLGGYTVGLYQDADALIPKAQELIDFGLAMGFDGLLNGQKESWAKIWERADITIEGDVLAQQAIRFNIFQLNQTYLGKDPRLNIGPKGFTGEKYGGSTYWDTEAYCLPFYMATKHQEVGRNLLTYRYKHLDRAIENAAKLGFSGGAALYPMVTMNGEECHNEWEITFEEIHRNGAIAYAIFNYERYTADESYMGEMGLEVLIGIARFWAQRATFSSAKNQYVILGVTGPNEYENNINNNFYTNFMARWCLNYTHDMVKRTALQSPGDHGRILEKTHLGSDELSHWIDVANNMYLPYDQTLGVYLQQDGFLDKELTPVAQLPQSQRPINQHWSWDRILRSVYIKQADVLQGFYFFEDQFTPEELAKHFDFYEPFTVHESSLSPCVHSIQAARLGRMDQAYDFYLRTARLDLDDYNKEVHEGCHITSMAGTWMSIVEGFGGMRIKEGLLHFSPKIPDQWTSYRFKINFRGSVLAVHVGQDATTVSLAEGPGCSVVVDQVTVQLTA